MLTRPALKIGLLAVLISFTLPGCELLFGDRKYYCGGGKRYVDVEGVELTAYQEPSNVPVISQSIRANELKLALSLKERRYGAVASPGGFVSLADCISPEYTESVDSVTITSRFDYDAQHPAGSSLNALLLDWRSGQPLNSLLSGPTSAESWGSQVFKLKSAPSRSGPQRFRVRYHQTNGEVFTAETTEFTLF